MLITMDQYGSITLPASVRKEFGLKEESYLDLSLEDDGVILLTPTSVQRNIRLNDKGLAKLEEARRDGEGEFPEWLEKEMRNARTETE